ncbi:SRPBCC family protein [Solwaraspora sp. WMMD406]|uniref:SRPBCC family protein n=1 Tax=Solwaraspora sp. WMMD406 TaxID=3016095 RepID=UPI002416C097|nr:SRPBCC family protein [Solwaraspora sp. WMMD406]MDG4766602.1 SRPBCC family protein [Solwaraspora sp. WMMD406]
MAVVQRVIPTSPDRVFAVLGDGWTYSDWVVGTVHVRDVDDHWPRPGARLLHNAGPWPLSLADSSTVVSCDPPHELILRAGLWPLGAATVTFRLAPTEANGTRVSIDETFTGGPLGWLTGRPPGWMTGGPLCRVPGCPLRRAWTTIDDLVLQHRNRETLRRLSDIATRQVNV